MSFPSRSLALLAGSLLTAGPAAAAEAPLFEDLGEHHRDISTSSELAQQYFDQGLILTYAFNHQEAIRSFREAARLDPECGICYWGVALAYGPNINAPMTEDAVPKAWNALQKALHRSDRASEVERALIEALSHRYQQEPPHDRSQLDRAYADAMREVWNRFPDDDDVGTLFAESLMDTTPWDYYADTEELTLKPRVAEAVTALEAVLERSPQHPGANHYFIHTVELAEPERAETHADRLRTLVPGAGHLVHMPSHIYLRVGRYADASLANRRAVDADESYIAQCNAQGYYPALYYPHNLHFLWYTTAMEGDSEASIAAARETAEQVTLEQIAEAPLLESFEPVPLFALARFGRWQEILTEPEPPEELLLTRGIWHYARGLASTARGELEDARAERAALRAIAGTEELQSLDVFFLYAGQRLEIADRVLSAAIAGREGLPEERIRRLREAVEIQDSLPYMEPPYWYYPVRQSLGRALLDAGRPEEAEDVFRRDLEDFPDNGWSLYGLAASLEAQGREHAADEARAWFEKAWSGADVRLAAIGFDLSPAGEE